MPEADAKQSNTWGMLCHLTAISGLILIPFEADMDPIFAPVDKSDSLVWEDIGQVEIKAGINYVE